MLIFGLTTHFLYSIQVARNDLGRESVAYAKKNQRNSLP